MFFNDSSCQVRTEDKSLLLRFLIFGFDFLKNKADYAYKHKACNTWQPHKKYRYNSIAVQKIVYFFPKAFICTDKKHIFYYGVEQQRQIDGCTPKGLFKSPEQAKYTYRSKKIQQHININFCHKIIPFRFISQTAFIMHNVQFISNEFIIPQKHSDCNRKNQFLKLLFIN